MFSQQCGSSFVMPYGAIHVSIRLQMGAKNCCFPLSIIFINKIVFPFPFRSSYHKASQAVPNKAGRVHVQDSRR